MADVVITLKVSASDFQRLLDGLDSLVDERKRNYSDVPLPNKAFFSSETAAILDLRKSLAK